eukprot:scaffold219396_cov37-Tisochrysis_lutea.AAC.4
MIEPVVNPNDPDRSHTSVTPGIAYPVAPGSVESVTSRCSRRRTSASEPPRTQPDPPPPPVLPPVAAAAEEVHARIADSTRARSWRKVAGEESEASVGHRRMGELSGSQALVVATGCRLGRVVQGKATRMETGSAGVNGLRTWWRGSIRPCTKSPLPSNKYSLRFDKCSQSWYLPIKSSRTLAPALAAAKEIAEARAVAEAELEGSTDSTSAFGPASNASSNPGGSADIAVFAALMGTQSPSVVTTVVQASKEAAKAVTSLCAASAGGTAPLTAGA